ncbi:MAG: DNA mismatch endonuclease Vsr [Spirochaetaceae bacterium]|nr:DNA mismatch endonuclease Vsr [Spirochaetaceae bacterium]
MDSLSPEARSRVMAAVRGRDTAPERSIRSALHARGYRFRVDARDLPGRPDLKLTRHGAVVFVHGCFWHGHDCPRFRAPLSNTAFWLAKIEGNRSRDRRVVDELLAAGWRVAVVWECALKGPTRREDPGRLVDALSRWIEGRRRFVEFSGRRGRAEAAAKPRACYERNDSAARFAAERSAAYRGLSGG